MSANYSVHDNDTDRSLSRSHCLSTSVQALQEGARLQSALHQQLTTLDRAQKNYEKAFREAERAEDAYRKADADLNLSRADVEKQRVNASIKNHQCEDNKNEYAKQLQKTNELQTQHYQVRTTFPILFPNLYSTFN